MARRFDASFVSAKWYRGSRSEQLQEYARSNMERIPEEWRSLVQYTIDQVYQHEETMHHLVKNIASHVPIHPDPYFVYEGYKAAMKQIMTCLQSLRVHDVSAFVWDFRDDILTRFHDILAVTRAEAHDRATYYKQV